jgi:hypothetical protein
MFRIMGNTANGPEPESNLATLEAANNRHAMLKRRYPKITFWIEPANTEVGTPDRENACEKTLKMPRVTVERIVS